jgi:pSer/pThr/pTyr-binding forkhead associated (FHA) protein
VTFAHQELTPTELAMLLAAERRARPFLTYRDGEHKQRVLSLQGERLSIGRDAGNDLPLEWDRETSRLHALLERLGGNWTVVDDGISRNGTLVNGVRVRGRRRLSDRDVIRCGSTQVLYRDPMQAADETPAAASSATVAGLTAAQRRVLLALCRPLLEATEVAVIPPSNGEIAAELTVSVEAVRTQMKTLFKLFEVPELPQNRKRAELARRALASGVVLPRDL